MAKPIKRSEHIMPLSREHHFSLLFSWKIRQGLKKGVELQRIINYVNHFFEHNLQVHFHEEEETLFAVQDDPMVQRALDEHQQVRKLVPELAEAPESEITGRLSDLADLVEKHVRYEERELFPHLEGKLSPEQLAVIGHQLQEMQPEPLTDNYPDEFWAKG